MTSNLKFCSLNDGDYEGSMSHLLQRAGMLPTNTLAEADIIVFNGGADIGTEIYNEDPITRGSSKRPSVRDLMEMNVFANYASTNKLLLGICRGAQLLNCLNGGTLWQDVNGHGRDHMMTDIESGAKIRITSTHHQMMRPNYSTAKLIAIADEATRKTAEVDFFPNGQQSYPDNHQDTEVVWYGNTHSLCIQGHPEYVPGSLFAEYCLEQMSKYLQEIRQFVA